MDNCYILEYKRGGKIPVIASVKTLYIRKDPKNGKYYLILPTSIYYEHHSNHPFTPDELFKIKCKLQTSWKELRNPSRNTQTCKLDEEICELLDGRTLKYAGVDLGYNNFYAITYYDVWGKNKELQWKELSTEIVSAIPNEQYTTLKWDMRRLIDIIRMNRQYLQGGKDIEVNQTDTENWDKLMALLLVEQRVAYTQFIETLKSYKAKGLLVKDIKGDRDWAICRLMYVLTQTMNRIHGNRDVNGKIIGNKNWLSHPDLIELIDTYYNLKKTFNDSGDGTKVLPKDHIYVEGEKKRLTVREEDFCRRILTWRDDLKDYLVKATFSKLAHQCHELGIGIVAMEDLEGIRGSSDRSKRSNRMFNIWPRGQMKKSAEDALGYMGILIQYVEADGTSQHDADTGIRGYREW